MSIELSSAPKGVKAVASGDPHGKKAGKPGDAAGSGGFSALMNLLSAADDAAASLAADTSSTDPSPAEKEGLSVDVTAAGGDAALLLPPFTVPLQVQGAVPADVWVPSELSEAALMTAQVTVGLAGIPGSNVGVGATRLVVGALPQPAAELVGMPGKEIKEIPSASVESGNLPNKVGQHTTTVADTGALQKSALASSASDALSARADTGQTPADLAQASPVSALLAHKSAVQAQTFNAAQQDLKEVRASAVSQSVVPVADAAATLMAGGNDVLRPQGRFGARPGSGQSGSSGFEGAFGQAMSATSRADAVFEVPPASAIVADTAVAETVSYWASQGVQTAELTLEGFGDEPVQVSILLNGDQAQIDFRTDQVGVRQVLEAAAAQLKDLLSSQGLQLAGVSVGTSGKGSESGGERRPRPGAQQITMVKTEPLGSAPVRAANPAVGRSLDLFV